MRVLANERSTRNVAARRLGGICHRRVVRDSCMTVLVQPAFNGLRFEIAIHC